MKITAVKVIALIALLSIATAAGAASAKFGLKGGFNLSSLPEDLTTSYNDVSIVAFSERYTGYHVGLVASFVLPGFFIQPELLFVSTGQEMVVDYDNGAELDDYFTQRFQHIAIPIHMGMKFGPVKIGAGPVFSFLLNESNNSLTYQDLKPDLSKAKVGYQLGVGFQLGGILLEGRYESNLTKFGEGLYVGNNRLEFDMRPSQFIISIGLLF